MEKYNIKDIIAQSNLCIDFISQYVATMKTNGFENVGITDFYCAFCKKNKITIEKDKNVLFTPALILGFLYSTFLLPEQIFYNNIPGTDNIDEDEWGIEIIKGTDKKLKYICRRMRNALSHNHFIFYKNFEFVVWDAKQDNRSIENAEVIYKFTFDSLMFKFIPKWQNLLLKQIQTCG